MSETPILQVFRKGQQVMVTGYVSNADIAEIVAHLMVYLVKEREADLLLKIYEEADKAVDDEILKQEEYPVCSHCGKRHQPIESVIEEKLADFLSPEELANLRRSMAGKSEPTSPAPEPLNVRTPAPRTKKTLPKKPTK